MRGDRLEPGVARAADAQDGSQDAGLQDRRVQPRRALGAGAPVGQVVPVPRDVRRDSGRAARPPAPPGPRSRPPSRRAGGAASTGPAMRRWNADSRRPPIGKSTHRTPAPAGPARLLPGPEPLPRRGGGRRRCTARRDRAPPPARPSPARPPRATPCARHRPVRRSAAGGERDAGGVDVPVAAGRGACSSATSSERTGPSAWCLTRASTRSGSDGLVPAHVAR